MLTERNNVHSKRKRLQYTGHTELQILLSISLFYCKCTVKWITEIYVEGYTYVPLKLSFLKWGYDRI